MTSGLTRAQDDEQDGELWDVAVIGTGPAGAAAARTAALGGARTLLLERAEIPRYKCCGGGLVGVSQDVVPIDLAPLERDRIHRLTVTYGGRWQFTRRRPAGRPVFTVVYRSDLDAALVRAAQDAGAVLRTGTVVTGLAEPDHGRDAGTGPAEPYRAVTISTRSGTLRARTVVGADGAGGRTGSYVGVRCEQIDLGLEAEIAVDPAEAARWRGRVLLDWGRLAGSYGWVFPKGDVLTVGVIGSRDDGEAVRDYYRRFLERLGLAHAEPLRFSGHLTRCRREDSPLRRGAVLLAGDAAGLLDPWTREGISFALRSGVLAGSCAAAAAAARRERDHVTAERELSAYGGRIQAGLGAEMAAGRAVLAAFSRRPQAFHAALATPPGWWMFARLVAGETTLARQLRRRTVRATLAALTS